MPNKRVFKGKYINVYCADPNIKVRILEMQAEANKRYPDYVALWKPLLLGLQEMLAVTEQKGRNK